jgi:osmotically-inducible protein OsmY
MDFRVRVVMGRLGSADAKAVREEIERHDAVRARTMMAYFNVEQEDARLYHLVLNTERLAIETCVRTIAQLAESPRLRGGAAVRSALADKLLEAKIDSAFAEQISPSMAPLGIAVSIKNGKITLRGISSSGALRRQAETIAHTVAGALKIDNRIVSVPSHGRF